MPVSSTHALQILLVEDHAFTAEVTKIILNEIDCQVMVASDAKSSIEYAKKHCFDLIFMDVGLPDLDGYQTTQWIRQNKESLNQRVPIVALTALADNQDKTRCLAAGMNAVLIKPIYKARALDILNALVPRTTDNEQVPVAANDTTDWSILPGKTIDLELGAAMFNGNIELAKKMLSAFITDLDHELEALALYYKIKEWDKFEAVVRRLQGAISYCSTPRLQVACSRLENHLHAGYRELAPLLYKQFLREVAAVKQEHEQLIH